MSDFDPNTDPEDQEAVDAYVNWCATNYERLSASPERTYRTAVRCAAWLFVSASAQIHLDDAIEIHRVELLEQLANYQLLGRAIERQRQHFPVERLIVLRSSLDCWEATGEWGDHLLRAAKGAVAAMTLIALYPLAALWDVECPDVWALLDDGAAALAEINLADMDSLTFDDFSVAPDETATAKWTWQVANNIVRQVGMSDLGEN